MNMNILIDGPSRSGKLLLAKLIMASPQIAFQHYSGDLERLVESIYVNRESKSKQNSLVELLRLNLVHTLVDLKSLRQLSINLNDSSYYQKSEFFELNKHAINDGSIVRRLDSGNVGFILHTHESRLFLEYLQEVPLANRIINHTFNSILSIIRNSPSQILSWLSRNYTDQWCTENMLTSPFTLYPSKYRLSNLFEASVNLFPWYVEASIDSYLQQKILTLSDLELLAKPDLLTICVCYLTDLYLSYGSCGYKASDESAANHPSAEHVFVFHENLHDNPSFEIARIFDLLSLNCCKDSLGLRIKNETSCSRFGRRSIEASLQKLLPQLTVNNVRDILLKNVSSYLHIVQ